MYGFLLNVHNRYSSARFTVSGSRCAAHTNCRLIPSASATANGVCVVMYN